MGLEYQMSGERELSVQTISFRLEFTNCPEKEKSRYYITGKWDATTISGLRVSHKQCHVGWVRRRYELYGEHDVMESSHRNESLGRISDVFARSGCVSEKSWDKRRFHFAASRGDVRSRFTRFSVFMHGNRHFSIVCLISHISIFGAIGAFSVAWEKSN